MNAAGVTLIDAHQLPGLTIATDFVFLQCLASRTVITKAEELLGTLVHRVRPLAGKK